MDSLARIEQSIRASDGEAIRARWEFGREVIAQRHGKKQPPGLTEEICQRARISQAELSNRTRVAGTYDEPFISSLINDGLTWSAIVSGLPKTPRTPRSKPEPTAPSPAAVVKDADKAIELFSRAGVAEEVMNREAADKATAKAQALAERRAREGARRQKAEDQERQQVGRALRQQLVQGDKRWENLTEHLEVSTDTVRRYLDFLDGMTVPDRLRLRRLDSQLGKLQQVLFELRRRLIPDYETPAADIGKVDAINAEAWSR